MSSSVRQIAAAAHVSPATVSRVLNGFPYVRRELRKRVLAAARKASYFLHQKHFLIIVPSGDYYCGYTGLMLEALEQEARKRQLSIVIIPEIYVAEIVETFFFDAAIALLAKKGIEHYWGREQIIPMVCINSIGCLSDNIVSVSSDNRQGTVMALDYLKRRGHRKIVLVNMDQRLPQESVDTDERQLGYLEWMEHNVPEAVPKIVYPLRRSNESVFRRLKQQGYTAAYVLGEGSAAKFYSILKQQKIRVPQDFSVIGMEHDHISYAMQPSETCIAQNWSRLSKTAFDVLGLILKKKPVSNQLIPYRMIERESVLDLLKKK